MRLLLLPLLLLAACQTHSQWNYCNIPAKGKNVCTRAIYKSSDEVLGIDIEFLQTSKGLATYLHMHTPAHEDAQILFKGKQGTTSFTLPIHKGGDRIRLSKEMQGELIALLKDAELITIEVDGCSETLKVADFKKILKKLGNPPFQSPFHLFF
ncbi:MAG: hypothetical protein KR126chlam1_00630 [Chlamydiae bacterium]|nr:hypothetical protein [Chlamydiota bacterium]